MVLNDFQEFVFDTIKELNVIYEIIPMIIFVEPKLIKPREITFYYLSNMFKKIDYDLSIFFLGVINAENLAFFDDREDEIKVLFLMGKKKKKSNYKIKFKISPNDNRVLGEVEFES